MTGAVATVGAAWMIACGSSQPPVLDGMSTLDAGSMRGDSAVAVEAGDGPSGDASSPRPLNVLFIGNSYTYTNDLPGEVAALAKTSGLPPFITTSSVVTGGATLGDLWDAGAAENAIASGSFTHVVLQEQSETPACAPAVFYQYAGLFSDAAKARGATSALFETWARVDGSADYASYPCLGGSPTAMQDLLLAAYEKAATQDGAVLVPVGEAWRAVIASYPSIQLFSADGSHPSVAGTYLSACVFYVKLTGQAVPTSAAVPAGIDPTDAAHLRDVALGSITPTGSE